MKRFCLAIALSVFVTPAFAQDYPTRTITLVSPFPPGGPSDTAARLIIGPMSKTLGQSIIVDNVTGAGGVIGTNRVAKAAPDGYQLVVTGSGTIAAAEFLQKNLPYRSADFVQIGLINISPMILVAKKDIPANTLQEFVEYVRKNEKTLTEADAGVGSISNLACAVFHAYAKVNPTVASYRGTPQATMDLLAGNVDFGCNQIVNVTQHVKTGAMKAYAVTSAKRSPMLPDVPTTAEAGMPEFNLLVWFGLSAPGHAAACRRKAEQGVGGCARGSGSGEALRRTRLRRRAARTAQRRLLRQIHQGRSRAVGQGARVAAG